MLSRFSCRTLENLSGSGDGLQIETLTPQWLVKALLNKRQGMNSKRALDRRAFDQDVAMPSSQRARNPKGSRTGLCSQ